MIPLTAITLFILGTIFGSFAGAQVWRLRALQLRDDSRSNKLSDKSDKRELAFLKKLFTKKFTADRSRCLHCAEQLKWYDLVPIISWLSTSGKCRYCEKPIGRFEIAIEAGVGLFFLVSYLIWLPSLTTFISAVQLMVWLSAGVILAMLYGYDRKWSLLPDSLNGILAILGLIFVILEFVGIGSINPVAVFSLAGSLVIMSGLYLALFVISKGAWIGFGDVKLGVGLGLFLMTWESAFLALFLANLLGLVVILPGLISGRVNRKTQVPFGPFLIVGTIIAFLFSGSIIQLYMTTVNGLFI